MPWSIPKEPLMIIRTPAKRAPPVPRSLTVRAFWAGTAARAPPVALPPTCCVMLHRHSCRLLHSEPREGPADTPEPPACRCHRRSPVTCSPCSSGNDGEVSGSGTRDGAARPGLDAPLLAQQHDVESSTGDLPSSRLVRRTAVHSSLGSDPARAITPTGRDSERFAPSRYVDARPSKN